MRNLWGAQEKDRRCMMAKRSPFLLYLRIILLAVLFLAFLLLTFSEAKRRERTVDFAEVYPIVQKYSEEYGIEENLILAMIRAASNFDANAVSSRGAIGLMQISPSTYMNDIRVRLNANEGESALYDPDFNVMCGVFYLRVWLDYFNSAELALAAYHAGAGIVRDWIQNPEYADGGVLKRDKIPSAGTAEYINNVLSHYDEYNKIYGEAKIERKVNTDEKRYVSRELCFEFAKKYAKIYDVNPYLVIAIAEVESSFNANALSKSNAMGLTQIKPDTYTIDIKANLCLDDPPERLYDPEFSIKCCAYYVSWIQTRLKKVGTGSDMQTAAAYHGGINTVRAWLSADEYSMDGELLFEKLPDEATKRYVEKIEAAYDYWKNK